MNTLERLKKIKEDWNMGNGVAFTTTVVLGDGKVKDEKELTEEEKKKLKILKLHPTEAAYPKLFKIWKGYQIMFEMKEPLMYSINYIMKMSNGQYANLTAQDREVVRTMADAYRKAREIIKQF